MTPRSQRENAIAMFGSPEPAHEVARDAEMYRKYDADTVEIPPVEPARIVALSGASVEQLHVALLMALGALKQIAVITNAADCQIPHAREASLTERQLVAHLRQVGKVANAAVRRLEGN